MISHPAGQSRTLYERHADICKVFSNATRLMVLGALRDGEMTVAAIAEKVGLGLGSVSPHLLMMKQRKVLCSRKQGNQVFYRVAAPKILRAFDLMRQILEGQIRQEGMLGRKLEQRSSRKQ